MLFYPIFPVILVCSGCEIADIQMAINLAKPGDTVLVNGGTYNKPVIINKPLNLKGENNPVLDGLGKHQPITIKADGVIVEGFIIKNSGASYREDIAGIKVENAKNCVIQNNVFLNNFFAISLYNVRNCTVRGNRIEGFAREEGSSGNGIHIWNGQSIRVVHNLVKGHRDGIYFEFVKDGYISDNESAENLRYGLHFMFSDDNIYEDNKFFKNGAGVAVMYSKRVVIRRNRFEENFGSANYGLLLKAISDSKLEQNIFMNNKVGAYLEECVRTIFNRNIFKSNGWALRILANSDGNKFYQNTFLNNTFDVSTNTMSHLDNLFEGNYYDSYLGYDLNNDGYGDIPHRPISISSVLYEMYPASVILYESPLMRLLVWLEALIPTLTPSNLIDKKPLMKEPK